MHLKSFKHYAAMTAFSVCSLMANSANAAVITFDTLVSGVTSYGYDGDSDNINDVIFSTTNPTGFNTVGPGQNMTYIQEPGIEGSSTLDPDLSASFINGATGSFTFSFALLSASSDPAYFASINVFDAANNLLGNSSQMGQFTPTQNGQSSFPEGQVSVSFSGVAAYATLDFASQGGRFILDNFEGIFGSTERPNASAVPESSNLLLLAMGLAGLVLYRPKYNKNILVS